MNLPSMRRQRHPRGVKYWYMLRKSLKNVRVADFSQIGAGPTCSMFLGDLGADVIKVEPPSGDIGRGLGPPWVADNVSSVFVAFNRNKRSICIDLKSEQGLRAAKRLVQSCDVLIESFRPGVMDRLGLGHGEVSADNPGIVYCSVSAYGSTGEAARLGGVDGIVQAESGLMSLLGDEGQPPSKVQAPVVDVTTGYVATIAVMAQLYQRQATGFGGYLDVSMLGAAVALQQSSLTGFLGDGELPGRLGSAAPYSAPNEAFPASDGWIMVAAYQGGRWERLCEILERTDLAQDPRFETSALRVRNRQAMRAELGGAFSRHPCAYWLERLMARDILCSKVCDYADLIENPAVAHLELITSLTDDLGRSHRVPGFPVNSRESQSLPHRAPPRLGQHTLEVLSELDFTAAEAAALVTTGAVFADRSASPAETA
ncbi:CoA transferase [Mesorhizobium sp. B2-1-3A]|uniref:CaiB/BaiF CoA transferase family protein n=1 Tax=Mesorhizobium sp. B2-1-3A TaxID=2589971 RepID=UPI001FEF843E|nr:CoA transferase [Mesorhizobium sp. B2-1-3A]